MTLPLDVPGMTREDDLTRAGLILDVTAPGHGPACSLVIPGRPHPQGRPKFDARSRRAYTAADDAAAARRTRGLLTAALAARTLQRLDGNVGVVLVFRRPDLTGCDADNLAKHVLDAATGRLWADDRQVTALTVLVELDRDDPRTVLVLAGYAGSLPRGVAAQGLRRPPRPAGRATAARRVLTPQQAQDAALVREAMRRSSRRRP